MSIGSVNVPGSIGAGVKSNSNLSDNSYWAAKEHIINQRGQLQYSGAGFTIDRWRLFNTGVTLAIEDGCVSLTFISTEWWKSFIQTLEGIVDPTQLTISLLYKGNNPPSFVNYINPLPASQDWTLASFTHVFTPEEDGTLPISLVSSWYSADICIKAAKIELGPVQTLAHKEGDTWVLNDPPPNKALELLKCQRYYRCGRLRFTTVSDDNKLYNPDADLIPVPMRIIPAYNFTNAVNSYGSPVDVTLANVFPANSFAFPTIEVYNPENLPQHITFDYEASADL